MSISRLNISPTPSNTPSNTPTRTPTSTACPTTPTPTSTVTPTSTSAPICPEQINLTYTGTIAPQLSAYTGNYNRLYSYSGGTFNYSFYQTPSNSWLFDTADSTGNFGVAWGRISGGIYYTLFALSQSSPSNINIYAVFSSTTNYNIGTLLTGSTVVDINPQISGSIKYPSIGNTGYNDFYVSYPEICPTATPTPTQTNTPTTTVTPTTPLGDSIYAVETLICGSSADLSSGTFGITYLGNEYFVNTLSYANAVKSYCSAPFPQTLTFGSVLSFELTTIDPAFEICDVVVDSGSPIYFDRIDITVGNLSGTLVWSGNTKFYLAGVLQKSWDDVSTIVRQNRPYSDYGCTYDTQILPNLSLGEGIFFHVKPKPAVTPTNTPTPSITPSNSPTPSITPTTTETPSSTPNTTPTNTSTPTETTTPTSTSTPTETIIATSTPTITPTQTNTPSSTPVCACYFFFNEDSVSSSIFYTPCGGSSTSEVLPAGQSVERCIDPVAETPSYTGGVTTIGPCSSATACTSDGDCTNCT